MITLDMVRAGYDAGIIRLIESPNGDGVVCGIGDNWFYFGGYEAEGSTVEDYLYNVPADDILKEIYGVLESFRQEGEEFLDEYRYYFYFLTEQLKERGISVETTHEKALRFIQENKDLAYEIFHIVDRMYQREDLISRLENHDNVNVEDFTDEEIDALTADFVHTLENNDSYWESYWMSADYAIDEFVKEKQRGAFNNGLFTVDRAACDKIVDTALKNIRGTGVDMGSGYYGLACFEVDGEKLNLYMGITRQEDEGENEVYYGVYYAVEYDGGDNLFSAWNYTAFLDEDELKQIVYEIATFDYTEDIRKHMQKESVGSVIGNATERSQESQRSGLELDDREMV